MTVLDKFVLEKSRLIFFKRPKNFKFQEPSLMAVPPTYYNYAKIMQLCLCIRDTVICIVAFVEAVLLMHIIFTFYFCGLRKSKVE